MKASHLIVDDLDVYYTESGEGPVILLLHGWGTSLDTFTKFTNEWHITNKRFIALDLPGFGKSQSPKEAWDVSVYAQFVRDFLDKLSIVEPQIVVGHSLGGRIAIKAIAKKNLSPQRLLLIASAGTAEVHSFRNTLFALLAKIGKVFFSIPPFSFFKESFRRKLYAAAGSTDYLNSGPMKETLLKVIKENLTEDAKSITIPTLLVWGEEDVVTPLVEAGTLHGAIKNSQLIVLPHAGHFVHEEQAKEVAEKTLAFIQS